MNKGKNMVLIVSILGTALLLVLRFSSVTEICYKASTNLLCIFSVETVFDLSIFFPLILFFSLLTYKMKDSAFKEWWQFAKWAIPIIFLVSFIVGQGYHHQRGGFFFDVNTLIDLTAYISMYSIFILGSTIQIFRGYNAGEEK